MNTTDILFNVRRDMHNPNTNSKGKLSVWQEKMPAIFFVQKCIKSNKKILAC